MTISDGLYLLLITIIIYTYLLYPIFIYIYSRLICKNDNKQKIDNFPPVTFIIPGHNIRHLIDVKIDSIMKLEYEGDLNFLFVLDGCTDGTEELLNEYIKTNTPYPINIYATSERNGKEAAIREALPEINTEVIVFSDSDALLQPDCVKELILKLMQDGVGAVSGREIHKKISNEGASEGQGLFYRYEEFLKTHLSKLGSLPYVQGGNFAMYRKLYPEEIPLGCTQDGIIAFDVVRKGYRVSYEPKAITSEEYNLTNKDDFSRRVRTITRALYSIICRPQILNPFKTGSYFIHIFSARIFRWFTVFFASFALVLGLSSANEFIFIFTILGMTIWLSLFILGYLSEKKQRRIKLAYFVYYFSYIHLAAAIAVINVLLGNRTAVWKPSN